eukprot:c5123_g1_i1.p1 GENE.c5123_g1_i1~~c5123_g1_i1.p1  ORF type:complete len:298 (+),score=75.82 c5123_g1_i1:37-930(+)
MGLRFDDKVAIVTGAGGALGKQYALALAERGAKVVVNDFSQQNAEAVVQEIKSKGGQAVVNCKNVLEGDQIVKTAIDTWGRLDIIISNAGILRDVSFAKMSQKQWNDIIDVHLHGTFSVVHAGWPHLLKSGSGRVVLVTSTSGLYGNHGQANYSAAKLAVVGLAKTLAKEGARSGVKVNAVAPGAGSAMTKTVMPAAMVDAWKAEYVAPVVAYMCHPSFPDSGKVFECGGGYVGEVHWIRTQGVHLDLNTPYTIDNVHAVWSQVTDRKIESDPEQHKGIPPMLTQVFARVNGNQSKL